MRMIAAVLKDAPESLISIPDNLRAVVLAQVILETGYARSDLANNHRNLGGLKWRSEMEGFATPVEYVAHDGKDTYCKFESIYHYFRGYWRFVHRPPYPAVDSAAAFCDMEFITYLKQQGYAEDPDYISKIRAKRAEAIKWLGLLEIEEEEHDQIGKPARKPSVTFKSTVKYTSGRSKKIDTIVIHYTTTDSDQSGLTTLTTGSRQASCHYLISKTGHKIWQIVAEKDTAWHAPGVNSNSIGIENSCGVGIGKNITKGQESKLIELIRYLLTKYGLSYKAVTAHKWVPYATSCPGRLLSKQNKDPGLRSGVNSTLPEFLAWRKKHFEKEFPAKAGERDRVVF